MALFTHQWTPVAADQARAHRHYGFGGWLYLLYGFAFIRVLMNLNNIFGPQMGMIGMYGEQNVPIMHVVMAFQTLCILPFLVLAPLKHELMPKVVMVGYGLGVLGFLTGLLFLTEFPTDRFIAVLINHGLTAALYSWYMGQSKRVNVTYRFRVRVQNEGAA